TQMITATAGDYVVTVTSADGCTGTANVSVSENSSVVFNISGTLSYCASEGNTLLDAGTYTSYTWSGGETSQTVTATAGVYMVTVSDANGCTGTASVEVIENANPMPSIAGVLEYCENSSTTLDAGTYVSYTWSSGETTQMITATTGDYIVTVTSADGCTGTASVEVIENTNPMPTITGTLEYCENGNTTLDAGVYASYVWSSGETTQTIAATAGDYTVTVTSADGCTGTANVSVSENSSVVFNISGTLSYCASEGNTLLDAGTYSSNDTYMWSSGETTQTIEVSTEGNFAVTVTNDAGCSGIASVETTVYAVPTPNITGAFSVCSSQNTILSVDTYSSYVWTNGATTQTVLAMSGTYGVTVTNANGCTGTSNVSISISAPINPVIVGTFTTCPGSDSVLDAGVYGLQSNTYTWSNGANTQVIQTNLDGIYSVTVTDVNGCSGTASTEVQDICNAFVSDLTHNGTDLCDGQSVDATVGSLQTLDGYDLLYLLFEVDNFGVTTFVESNDNGTFTPAPGNYQICAYVELRDCAPSPSPFVDTIHDMTTIGSIHDGCYDYECSTTIIVPESFETLAGTGQSSENNSTGQNVFLAEICGGVAPYSETFVSLGGFATATEYPSTTPGCVTYQIVYVDAAEWTLTVTDANGCSDSEVTFTSDGLPTNPLPQITGYVIVPEVCPGDFNGSITVEVEGGDNSCADYTYDATGPNSYSSTGTFPAPSTDAMSDFLLDGLASGIYDVTVTDCDGTTTVQELYVGRSGNGGRGRGRGDCTTAKTSWNGDSLVENWNVYPNPLTNQTTIEFTLAEAAYITANIYSVEGRMIAQVFEGTVAPQNLYQIPLNASKLPAGVYILQFTMDNGTVYYEKLFVKK
ncbi:MAG: T9SS type A sorting domain-containing protein, partial [Chitinophagales bacterium]